MAAAPPPRWAVYALVPARAELVSTYVGATVDLDRRLRQHNRELAGGARATGRIAESASWQRSFAVTGFPDERAALQFEWALKRRRREQRDRARDDKLVAGLVALLQRPRPTRRAAEFAHLPFGLTAHLETAAAAAAWARHGGRLLVRGELPSWLCVLQAATDA